MDVHKVNRVEPENPRGMLGFREDWFFSYKDKDERITRISFLCIQHRHIKLVVLQLQRLFAAPAVFGAGSLVKRWVHADIRRSPAERRSIPVVLFWFLPHLQPSPFVAEIYLGQVNSLSSKNFFVISMYFDEFLERMNNIKFFRKAHKVTDTSASHVLSRYMRIRNARIYIDGLN